VFKALNSLWESAAAFARITHGDYNIRLIEHLSHHEFWVAIKIIAKCINNVAIHKNPATEIQKAIEFAKFLKASEDCLLNLNQGLDAAQNFQLYSKEQVEKEDGLVLPEEALKVDQVILQSRSVPQI
jgi:hypothetical protein